MGDENNGGSSAAQPQPGLQSLKQYNVRVDHATDNGRGRRPSHPSSLLARFDDRWPATAADAIAVLLSVAVAWCLLCVNVTPALMAVPGGSVASIFMLYAVGLAAGHAVDVVGGLPPLLGMMVAGIALQNLGLYTVTAEWCVQLVAIMREAALSVILIKGGLEMNATQLRRLSGAVTRLALLPCIAEAVAAAVAAHYILHDFSWEWGLMLGFVLSAVSPAVLVPNLLKLKHMGYGEKNGVNTLVIAASSLDDIVSISAFGVLSGIVFSTGNLTSKIVQGPEDVCIGTALGLVWGFLLIFVPPAPWANVSYAVRKGQRKNDGRNDEEQADQSLTAKRAFLLGAGGFLAVTGSQLCGYPGAGPLACIISSFVAGTGWKWREEKQNCDRPTTVSSHDDEDDSAHNKVNPVETVFEYIWFGLQPVLFASIGTEVKFELLKGSDIVIAGLLVLICGLIVRLIVTSCAVWGAGLNIKEVIFINIAWLPKATVQAALAPVALDMARMMGTDEDKESASRLLTIAVISILVTAPLGAFGIQWFGPRLLSYSR
ncbi:sodium/hydrogen exchanger 9B2-like isoform X2 [Melanaphis sacchari]|uniref:Mitochondrial sodium/hydrogen exchanger 9B2 n=2 Tax=Melanaphis sacchari TaxID=742174 RepID=A0A2H8TN50_9HEMI|nr:sodium/hydrogen exchanger 9B2-like isoform X2 [Melanaphis sacchari]XP_025202541.1 sodium/hydrogen exchanger 9B2-like isoform X2 [Melanaphis sacchari]